MSKNKTVRIVYDKECPVCDFYCRKFEAGESEDGLLRINARDQSDLMDEITELGLDIDEGMVVKVDDRLYYGSDAIHELALLSSGKGIVNRIGKFAFRSTRVAAVLYPVMKFFRNLLLKILGKSRINNLQQPGHERF